MSSYGYDPYDDNGQYAWEMQQEADAKGEWEASQNAQAEAEAQQAIAEQEGKANEQYCNKKFESNAQPKTIYGLIIEEYPNFREDIARYLASLYFKFPDDIGICLKEEYLKKADAIINLLKDKANE